MKRAQKHTPKSYTYKIGLGLLILLVIAVGIVWLTRSSSSARTTEATAQNYLDFILQGDEESANQLTHIDAVCSPPEPSMRTEIATQTAVFAQTKIRNLTIITQPTSGSGFPPEAETANIEFEFQPDANSPWVPASLWIVTMPEGPNSRDTVICNLGGSSLLIPQ